MSVERELTIVNEKGLHARASARFVETVERFEARVEVSRDGVSSSGDSIMGLLMLGASRGTSILVRADGPDAEKLIEAIDTLVNECFGEDM
ncbi:MAG: HPr family phosphocarrier protein [Rhodobacteraceae bacterium]|nr:HPr family phosphocarrier protein [Paracoccaceae bacterium]